MPFAFLGGIVVFAIWLYVNRERTEWRDDVPDRFGGEWQIIWEYYYSEPYGITVLNVRPTQLHLTYAYDDGSKEVRVEPVKRVSVTTRRDSDRGSMIIYYGDLDDRHIASGRLEIYFTAKEQISVWEIVPTGIDNEDYWFETGDFVRIH